MLPLNLLWLKWIITVFGELIVVYDIKIINGTIIDGSGAKAYAGEVGIKDGKIVALGNAPDDADQVIDAKGNVVCPGFVDIHTHYDAQIIWDRMLTISPWHGVTTTVLGNCGFGVAPTRAEHRDLIVRTLEKVEGMSAETLFEGLGDEWPFETFPEYLDAIEASGSAINVAVMIGHTPLRLYVLGEEATEREATEQEIATMRAIVKESLEAGAIGFASSKSFTHSGYKGKPVPSRLASTEEIMTLASPLGELGQGIMQATVGPGLSFDEFDQISLENKANVSWTALLAGGGMFGLGSIDDQLKRTQKSVDKGAKVYPQVTCRPLNFEFSFKEPFVFEMLPLFKKISASTQDEKMATYDGSEFREFFTQMVEKGRLADAWTGTAISWCPAEPALEERLIVDVAKERGLSSADCALDLALRDNLETRFRLPVANADEDQVATLLQDPNIVLGLSDAGAHASQLCDACFSTHLLGHWVREKETLSLEQAVFMLTHRAAQVFGITDRGLLALDRPADVVIFDPETVGCSKLERVFDQPGGADRLVSYASGIDAVVVNGTLLRQNDQDVLSPTGPLPGRLLRNGSA
ncbi:MAG: amidohydrolase [Gammaproteobacteria bacterium]|nr:MAG: amidohydrolase [Gammaproteobacteria bacterium]